MNLLTDETLSPLVVTLCVDVLENNKETFSHHLDHHLKSDNWARYVETTTIYLKNNYVIDHPDDFELAQKEFAQDLQALFSVSNSHLITHCSCDEPIRGIAQLGNLGHVTFNVCFDAKTKKFLVSCSEIKNYGDQPDFFAEFENA